MLTTFLHLTALPAWLALPRDRRSEIAGDSLARASFPSLRHFDAEAFTAMCSDIVMVQAEDAVQLNHAMERLRDTVIFSEPFFALNGIYPCLEDGFRQFETAEAAA